MKHRDKMMALMAEECEKHGYKFADLGKRGEGTFKKLGEVHKSIQNRSPQLLSAEQQAKILGLPESLIRNRMHLF